MTKANLGQAILAAIQNLMEVGEIVSIICRHAHKQKVRYHCKRCHEHSTRQSCRARNKDDSYVARLDWYWLTHGRGFKFSPWYKSNPPWQIKQPSV